MRRAVILFDNDCGFCRWSLSKLLAWDLDGRLRPVGGGVTAADAPALQPGLEDHN